MADLTPDRLQELRRIAEAATPGPLTVHLCDDARYAAFVDAPHLGPDTPELAVFLIERDAHFFAEFDRDTVLAMLNEVEHLRREVREWMCDGCSTVYPDPPQPGIWCVQCPRCGGDTAPRGVIERRRLEREIERLRAELERLRGALNISPDDVGRIMHESWSRTKRSQGFHHPSECPNGRWVETAHGRAPCPKCHADLIPWDNLPEPQKDINRHAFDDVLAEIRRRAAIAERGGESG